MCDITTPTRWLLIKNYVWDFNLVGVVMSCVILITKNTMNIVTQFL